MFLLRKVNYSLTSALLSLYLLSFYFYLFYRMYRVEMFRIVDLGRFIVVLVLIFFIDLLSFLKKLFKSEFSFKVNFCY